VLSSASISKVNAAIQLAMRKSKRFHFLHSASAFYKSFPFSFSSCSCSCSCSSSWSLSSSYSNCLCACHLKSQSFGLSFISVQTVGVAVNAQRHKW